jgi:hypothetical protein
MRQLVRWASGSAPLDYTFLDCYGCHHDLRKGTAEGQPRGRPGNPGDAAWNAKAWAACRQLVSVLLPGERANFDRNIDALFLALGVGSLDRARVGQAAGELFELSSRLAETAQRTEFGQEDTLALLRGLATDGASAAPLGYRAAEQLFRSLEALYLQAFVEANPDLRSAQEINGAIEAVRRSLYKSSGGERIPSPETFNPAGFEMLVRDLGAKLPAP